MLAQGRFWRATLAKGEDAIVVTVIREGLSEDLKDLREFRFEVPFEKWNRVVKHVRSDRKLLGGILLDFAKDKELVSAAVGNDRLFGELQQIVLDTTASLIETGGLSLTVVDVGGD
jgi:hypothetical protein